MAFDPSGVLGGGLPAAAPPPPVPAPQPPQKWHDVTVRRTKRVERCIIAPVPPEEFGISRFARNIKDCGYCFHEVIKRESDLIEQGYDADQVHNLNTYSAMTNQEELARDTVEERQGTTGDAGLNRANREVKITEHYIKIDYEGNGKPCMYRISTGGDPAQILRRKAPGKGNRYAEEIIKLDGPPPFAAITPIIMTHRFFGRSVADVVMDIQRMKTVLWRGLLDNMYLRNNIRIEVPESHAGPTTTDDLLTSRPGGIVRTRQPGGLNQLEVQDISEAIYPALQALDTMREWRSGVSRQGQGVDGNSLQNQVATIANQMVDASQAKVKLIARIFAETGIKDLFALVHQTLRRHGTQAQTIRLRGNWVEIDPREWKSRSDLKINVGLGNNDLGRQLAKLQLLIGAQEKAIQTGSLVSSRNLYNSAKELVKIAHPGADTNTYFTDPSQPPNPQDPASRPLKPPDDGKQADVQARREEAQGKLQLEAAKAQHDISVNQARMALEDKQAQADVIAQQTKIQAEAALQQQKFEHEKQLAFMRFSLEEQKHQQEMRHTDERHSHELTHMATMATAKAKAASKPKPQSSSSKAT